MGADTTFLDKRTELEAIAVDIRENPGTSHDEFEIGPFDINRARGGLSGEVYFVDNSTIFFSFTSGWVYSPDHAPARPGRCRFLRYSPRRPLVPIRIGVQGLINGRRRWSGK